MQTQGWQYVEPGIIDTVQPSLGQVGTGVTISGSRLLGGGSSVVSVILSGVAASAVWSDPNSQVVAVAVAVAELAGAAGGVQVISKMGGNACAKRCLDLACGKQREQCAAKCGPGTIVTTTGTYRSCVDRAPTL